MFGAILKATNSSFQNGMTFCRSIYVKKVMKLLAFIFEQPSYGYHTITVNLEIYARTLFSLIVLKDILGEELYKLHASVLILILLFQFVFTMYKLI